MKKIVLILSMTLIVLLGNVTSALGDAMSYNIEDAGYYVYVATPDGGLNMRYGPGTEYERVMDYRIPDDTRLYIGYVSGNWGYTSYNGNEGWVALRQTTTTPPTPKSTPTPIPTAVPTPVATDESSALQSATSESQITDNVAEVIEEAQEITQDAEIVKTAMLTQIVLVAALVLLVIVIAVLIVVIINLKSKR